MSVQNMIAIFLVLLTQAIGFAANTSESTQLFYSKALGLVVADKDPEQSEDAVSPSSCCPESVSSCFSSITDFFASGCGQVGKGIKSFVGATPNACKKTLQGCENSCDRAGTACSNCCDFITSAPDEVKLCCLGGCCGFIIGACAGLECLAPPGADTAEKTAVAFKYGCSYCCPGACMFCIFGCAAKSTARVNRY